MFDLILPPTGYLASLNEALTDYDGNLDQFIKQDDNVDLSKALTEHDSNLDQHLKEILDYLNLCKYYINKHNIKTDILYPLKNHNIDFRVIKDIMDPTLFTYDETEIDGIQQEIITINEDQLTSRIKKIEYQRILIDQNENPYQKGAYKINHRPPNDKDFIKVLKIIKSNLTYIQASE